MNFELLKKMLSLSVKSSLLFRRAVLSKPELHSFNYGTLVSATISSQVGNRQVLNNLSLVEDKKSFTEQTNVLCKDTIADRLNFLQGLQSQYNSNTNIKLIHPVFTPSLNVYTPLKKKIENPNFIIPFEIPPGVGVRKSELILPNIDKKDEMISEMDNVIEKKAIRMIVIRRQKMKRHKWKKLQKKMKYVFAKIRQRRELRKEKEFQSELLTQIKAAESFNAAQYVSERLKIVHEQLPINRVRGVLAPEYVIKEYVQEKEYVNKMFQRVKESGKKKGLQIPENVFKRVPIPK